MWRPLTDLMMEIRAGCSTAVFTSSAFLNTKLRLHFSNRKQEIEDMGARGYLSFVAVVFFITGCASITEDILVDTDTHPKANLKAYKTFTWVSSAELVYDPQGQWEHPEFDADVEILWLIRRELRRRGMTEVEVNPDLLVGFATGVNMAALKLKRNPETRLETLENVPKAALVVVLVDSRTGLPVWVGRATGELQEEVTNEVVRKRLNYAVNQMFKKMPR